MAFSRLGFKDTLGFPPSSRLGRWRAPLYWCPPPGRVGSRYHWPEVVGDDAGEEDGSFVTWAHDRLPITVAPSRRRISPLRRRRRRDRAGDQTEHGFIENLDLAVPEPYEVLFFELPQDTVDA
jgi:hypothetical protein